MKKKQNSQKKKLNKTDKLKKNTNIVSSPRVVNFGDFDNTEDSDDVTSAYAFSESIIDKDYMTFDPYTTDDDEGRVGGLDISAIADETDGIDEIISSYAGLSPDEISQEG